jgi:6-pyruvoyltetrahydropterin/6-carboxytetrahydropterin synthase
MKISAVRILKFDAGHRVCNHESKCRTLHGHEYKAHIYAEADQLDSLGRIIDFSVIKEKVGSWIDLHWDHNMILWENDINLPLIQQCDGLKAVYVTKYNPTAENMAQDLIQNICPKLLKGTGITIAKIRLYETTNCYVEVSNV